jgi:hypothetical protein
LKNIVIVLILAVVGAVAGWVGTMVVVQHHQNAAYSLPAPTGDATQDMKNAWAFNGRASGDMAKRQTGALIGGGLGLAAGVALGFGVASMVCKPQSDRSAA